MEENRCGDANGHLVNLEISEFYGTISFITVFTTANHLSFLCARVSGFCEHGKDSLCSIKDWMYFANCATVGFS